MPDPTEAQFGMPVPGTVQAVRPLRAADAGTDATFVQAAWVIYIYLSSAYCKVTCI